jgi:hypothetical protein
MSAREGRSDVRNGGFAGGWIQSGQFDHDFRFSAIQKFLGRVYVCVELRIDGEAAQVDGRAVAQGLNGDDAERENFTLLFEQARECPPDVAIAEKRQPQKSIRSINEFRSDSSVVRARRS